MPSEPKLNPFVVDPDQLERMHHMRPEHLADVCRLHHAAMGNSLWAQLGHSFLRQVYDGLIEHPDFIGFVYQEGGRVRGFIAGTGNGPRMLRDVMRRRAPRLALATARGLLRRPKAARHLLETLRYFRKSSLGPGDEVVAESMFCTFEPELRGKRISGLINKLLFDELAGRGHRYVKITTEADNQGAVRQLTSWGFEQMSRFRFYGKEMIIWHLDLEASERVHSPESAGSDRERT
jgi:hypothetical protein